VEHERLHLQELEAVHNKFTVEIETLKHDRTVCLLSVICTQLKLSGRNGVKLYVNNLFIRSGSVRESIIKCMTGNWSLHKKSCQI